MVSGSITLTPGKKTPPPRSPAIPGITYNPSKKLPFLTKGRGGGGSSDAPLMTPVPEPEPEPEPQKLMSEDIDTGVMTKAPSNVLKSTQRQDVLPGVKSYVPPYERVTGQEIAPMSSINDSTQGFGTYVREGGEVGVPSGNLIFVTGAESEKLRGTSAEPFGIVPQGNLIEGATEGRILAELGPGVSRRSAELPTFSDISEPNAIVEGEFKFAAERKRDIQAFTSSTLAFERDVASTSSAFRTDPSSFIGMKGVKSQDIIVGGTKTTQIELTEDYFKNLPSYTKYSSFFKTDGEFKLGSGEGFGDLPKPPKVSYTKGFELGFIQGTAPIVEYGVKAPFVLFTGGKEDLIFDRTRTFEPLDKIRATNLGVSGKIGKYTGYGALALSGGGQIASVAKSKGIGYALGEVAFYGSPIRFKSPVITPEINIKGGRIYEGSTPLKLKTATYESGGKAIDFQITEGRLVNAKGDIVGVGPKDLTISSRAAIPQGARFGGGTIKVETPSYNVISGKLGTSIKEVPFVFERPTALGPASLKGGFEGTGYRSFTLTKPGPKQIGITLTSSTRFDIGRGIGLTRGGYRSVNMLKGTGIKLGEGFKPSTEGIIFSNLAKQPTEVPVKFSDKTFRNILSQTESFKLGSFKPSTSGGSSGVGLKQIQIPKSTGSEFSTGATLKTIGQIKPPITKPISPATYSSTATIKELPSIGLPKQLTMTGLAVQQGEDSLREGLIPSSIFKVTPLSAQVSETRFSSGLKNLGKYKQPQAPKITDSPALGFGTALRTDLATTPATKLDFKMDQPQVPINIKSFNFESPRGFVPFGFSIPPLLFGGGKPKRAKVSRKFKRRPSLVAAEFGITSVEPGAYEFTGLTTRPLIRRKKKRRK